MRHVFMSLATLLGGVLGISQAAFAQGNYTEDALMLTRQGPAGTARTLGIGGANVALGADFGSVTSNPAGLGFYTKSELTLTPGIGIGNANAAPISSAASRGGASLTQAANSFHIANAGVVFASRHPDGDDRAWRGGAFALGFTRLADFNKGFRYQNTTDDDHSFFQYFREPGGYGYYGDAGYQGAVNLIRQQDRSGNYINLDGLAYGNFLTSFVRVPRPGRPAGDTTTVYRTATPTRTGSVLQNEQVVSKGSLSQFDIAYGGSYRDRLYVGIGVGIVSLNRTLTSTTSESSGAGTGFGEDFNFQQYTRTTGTGINARLGLIYRPLDVVRLGASIQTPTYIRLNEEYSTTLTSQYAPANYDNVLTTVPGTNTYSITTPFRANGGIVVLLNKYGFLSGDIEYVGYSQARYGSNTNDLNSELEFSNQDISNGYRNTVNLRVGAEGRFDVLRVRVGYARYGNPYVSTALDRAQNYITGGLGLRMRNFFIDASGVYLTYKEQYSPYSLAAGPGTVANGISPVIDYTQKRFTASITGGLTF
jgi:hypothetical protein